ncbi:MAG: hypothetical protein HUJ26_22095 [Planctomycetaceae bacterium]|nr:hypothetical protein [Planctomycetaceae bacterium]
MSFSRIVFFLLIVLALALFFWPDGSKKRKNTIEENPVSVSETITEQVNRLFDDIAAEQVAGPYRAATSAFREEVSLEEFQSFCDNIATRLGALQEHEIEEMMINEKDGQPIVTAAYRGEFEQGDGLISVIYHQEENSVWRLQHLNVNAPQLNDDPGQFQEPVERPVE